MKNISVLSVKVGEEPAMISVPNTLEVLQKLVGGHIQTVQVTDDILLVIDEEGMLKERPVNFATGIRKGSGVQWLHAIHGDVLFVSVMGEDFTSLDKEQAQRVKAMFRFSREACIVR
jgi:hypothetical protein